MEKLMMKAGHQILHTIVIFLAILCLSEAKPRCLLFNFGDSNSDTGNSLSLFSTTDSGRLFFHHLTGRMCDGRLILDFLCQNTSLPLLSTYMRSFDGDFHNGANFAISGARAMDVNCFSLKYQIRNFLSFKSLVAAHKASDIKISQDEYRSAVYMFDIGQNDITSTLDLPNSLIINTTLPPFSLHKSVAVIPHVIAVTKKSIQTLYKKVGARKFWVHNTGPLGCLRNAGGGLGGSPWPPFLVLDSLSCAEVPNNASRQLNIQLRKLVEELRVELPGSSIVYVDVYSIKYDLFANYKKYGFLSRFRLCTDYSTICPVGANHISYEGTHYMEYANSIVASKILSGQYSDPPIKFGDFCDA